MNPDHRALWGRAVDRLDGAITDLAAAAAICEDTLSYPEIVNDLDEIVARIEQHRAVLRAASTAD